MFGQWLFCLGRPQNIPLSENGRQIQTQIRNSRFRIMKYGYSQGTRRKGLLIMRKKKFREIWLKASFESVPFADQNSAVFSELPVTLSICELVLNRPPWLLIICFYKTTI